MHVSCCTFVLLLTLLMLSLSLGRESSGACILFGVPPCLLLVKKLPLFWPILTCFDLFRRADLTYFHLFRPIRRADPTCFHPIRPILFHTKAPCAGHLKFYFIDVRNSAKSIPWCVTFVLLHELSGPLHRNRQPPCSAIPSRRQLICKMPHPHEE